MVCTPSSAAADRTMGGRRRREATPAKQRCLRMTRGLLRKALASFTVHPPSPGAWSSVRREPVSEAGKRASSPSIQRALVALAWNTTAAAAGSCTEHRSLCRRAEPFRRRTSCGERGGVEDMLSRRPVAAVHKLAADGASEATTRQVIAGHEAERGEGGGRWSFWLGGMTSLLPCSPLNQVLHRGQHCLLMSLSK